MVGATFPSRPASRGGIVVRVKRRSSGGGVGTVGELKEKGKKEGELRKAETAESEARRGGKMSGEKGRTRKRCAL